MRLKLTRMLFILWAGLMFFSMDYERQIAHEELVELFKVLIRRAEDKRRVADQINAALRVAEREE